MSMAPSSLMQKIHARNAPVMMELSFAKEIHVPGPSALTPYRENVVKLVMVAFSLVLSILVVKYLKIPQLHARTVSARVVM